MDSSSAAAEMVTLCAASGYAVHFFPTGQGNVIGNPILPVIKICANPRTVRLMSEHVDVDTSGLLQREMNLDEAGDKLLECMLRTANGRLTAAEALGHREFVLTRLYESRLRSGRWYEGWRSARGHSAQMKIVITEFMDEPAVARLAAVHDVLYDPKLVDDPRRGRRTKPPSADALIVRNRTQVRGELLAAMAALQGGRAASASASTTSTSMPVHGARRRR